jgi:hypothetical protein
MNKLNHVNGNATAAGLDLDGELIFITNNPVKIIYPKKSSRRPEGEEIEEADDGAIVEEKVEEKTSIATLRLKKIASLAINEDNQGLIEAFVKSETFSIDSTPSKIKEAYKIFEASAKWIIYDKKTGKQLSPSKSWVKWQGAKMAAAKIGGNAEPADAAWYHDNKAKLLGEATDLNEVSAGQLALLDTQQLMTFYTIFSRVSSPRGKEMTQKLKRELSKRDDFSESTELEEKMTLKDVIRGGTRVARVLKKSASAASAFLKDTITISKKVGGAIGQLMSDPEFQAIFKKYSEDPTDERSLKRAQMYLDPKFGDSQSPHFSEAADLEEAIVYRDIRHAIELLRTTPGATKFRDSLMKKDQDAKISSSDLKKAKEIFANMSTIDSANVEKKRKDRYFPRFGVKALEESTDLEEGSFDKLEKKLGRINPDTLGDVLKGKIKLNSAEQKEFDAFMKGARKMFAPAEETDLEEATELYKKGKITLTKFAMGKGKGAGLQVNYGMKFIQIPKEDVKQLYTGMAYITKSVPQFKESIEESTDLEEMSEGQTGNVIATAAAAFAANAVKNTVKGRLTRSGRAERLTKKADSADKKAEDLAKIKRAKERLKAQKAKAKEEKEKAQARKAKARERKRQESTDLEEAKIPSSNISKFSSPQAAKRAASKQKYKTQIFMGDDGTFWVPSTNKEGGQLKKAGYEVYESADLEEEKRMKYDKVIKKLKDGEWDTSMDVKQRMHLTYTDNNTGRKKVVFVEANDLEEAATWKSEGHYTADGKEWTGDQHEVDGQVMTGKVHTDDSVNLYHFKELSPEVRKQVAASFE